MSHVGAYLQPPLSPIRFRVNGRAVSQGSKNPVVPTYGNGMVVRRHVEGCEYFGMTKGTRPEYDCKCPVMINVVEDNAKELEGWRTQIGIQARIAMHGREILDGCLTAYFVFHQPRPAGHYGTGANSKILKHQAPAMPCVKPDGLKLARAIEDAISEIVYVDDARIVNEYVGKRYIHRWEDPFVDVAVCPSAMQTVLDMQTAGVMPRPEEEMGQLGLLDLLSV